MAKEQGVAPPTKSTFRRHTTASSLSIWGALKEAMVPVLVYQAAATFSYIAWCASILITDSFNAENLLILGGLGVVTAAGVITGQVLAFMRVRSWILMLFGTFCWVMFFVFLASTAAGTGGFGVLIALAFFVFPVALTGGLWSLETHRALWSTWLPFLFSTAAVLIWSQARGSDAEWFAGNKWAIWDIASTGVLGVTIVLVLIYLITRETHRLALWRRGPTAPLAASVKEVGATRPRLTILSSALLVFIGVMLTIATAVVSPYLWRSGPGDGNGDGGEPIEQPQEPKEQPEPEPAEDSELLKRIGEAMKEMAEKAVEAGKQSGGAVCISLTTLLLAILGLMIGYRPVKRLLVVRHLKEPFWAVSPTRRIDQGWRLVEIALGDAGVHPHPGEDAAGLARRAGPVLAQLSPVEVHGLEDAAEVADRVRFGLGVGADDLDVMQRFSAWAIDTVWERLSDAEQVRCMYRDI